MNTANTQPNETKTADQAAPAGASQASSAVLRNEQPQEPHAQHLQPDAPPRPAEEATETRARRPRGFAAIDRKLLAEIASKGGKAAHSAGTAHEFTSAEAREAGRKGGLATHAKRRKSEE
jgi:general stress protein YciG